MRNLKLFSAFVLGILALTSFAAANGSDDYGNCPYMGMMAGSYGFGFGLLGWLFSILVIVALVLLIIWLIKQIQKSK